MGLLGVVGAVGEGGEEGGGCCSPVCPRGLDALSFAVPVLPRWQPTAWPASATAPVVAARRPPLHALVKRLGWMWVPRGERFRVVSLQGAPRLLVRTLDGWMNGRMGGPPLWWKLPTERATLPDVEKL